MKIKVKILNFYKRLIASLILVTMLFFIASPCFASYQISSASLFNKGEVPYHLRFWDTKQNAWSYVITHYIKYSYNGNEYPAYCLQKDKHGVETANQYSVSVQSALTDTEVYKVIMNGFPNKTPSQLGFSNNSFENEMYAFQATKQAVYCVIYGINPETYFQSLEDGADSIGATIRNAIINMVNTRNNARTYRNPQIYINKQGRISEENINGIDYFVQYCNATANCEFSSYDVTLSNFIEGTKVFNLANNVQNWYNGTETFKVAIPKATLKTGTNIMGIINIVNARMKSYPILYGKAPNSNWQDYALVTDPWEIQDTSTPLSLTIPNVTISKRDRTTKKTLAGAEYDIYLDSNKNGKIDNGENVVVHTNPTGNNGNVQVTNLNVSNYIARETKAPQGYNLDDKDQPFEVKVNSQDITVNSTDTAVASIIKTERNTDKKLAGAVYDIYKDTNSNGIIDKEESTIYTTKPTNENGITTVCELTKGSYIARETKAPQGYNLDDKDQHFVISENNTQSIVTSTDTPVVEILKKERGTETKLQGAVYDIYKDSNANGIIDNKEEIIYTTGETNENGITKVCELTKGSYIARETKAPKGYNLDDKDQPFTISDKNMKTILNSTDTAVANIIKTERGTETKLPGAVYEIYEDVNLDSKINNNDKLIYTTKPTDNDGKTSIKELNKGSYIAKEIKAPVGYNLDDKDQSFVISENNTKTVINSTDTPVVEIIKTDRETGSKLQGAVYDIYKDTNANGIIDNKEEVIYTTGETNENGITKVCELTKGSYIARELKSPKDYNIDDKDQPFIISETGEKVKIKSTNTPVVEIIKADRETEKKLQGAVYDIYKDTNANGIIDNKEEVIYTTEETNENGITKVCELTKGSYIAREVKSPKGYNIDDKDQPFTISETGKKITLISTDTQVVEIIKRERGTETKLPGAVYGIYEDINSNKKVDKEDKLVYATKPTDKEGKTSIKELPKGKYVTKEIKAPKGYNLDDVEHNFEISSEGKKIIINSDDTIITSTVEIIKVAEDDSKITQKNAGDKLQGAIFNLYDENHKLLKENLETDENGKAILKDLRYGKYYIEEIKAPEYYLLNPDEKARIKTVEVQKQGEIISLEYKNEAVKISLDIEKDGIIQAQPNDEIKYTFPSLKNTSNVPLDNFTWTDKLPTEYIKLTKIFTGTYNEELEYSVSVKTNKRDYFTIKEGLSTLKNNYIDIISIGLENDEYVTDYKFNFGTVKKDFSAVETPFIFTKVLATVKAEDKWTNYTKLSGDYKGIYLEDNNEHTVISYGKELNIKNGKRITKLPKTGY